MIKNKALNIKIISKTYLKIFQVFCSIKQNRSQKLFLELFLKNSYKTNLRFLILIGALS